MTDDRKDHRRDEDDQADGTAAPAGHTGTDPRPDDAVRAAIDAKINDEPSDEERERVLAMFPKDRDQDVDATNTDEFAAAREVDPDVNRLTQAAEAAHAEAKRRAAEIASRDHIDEAAVKPYRIGFHILAGLAAVVLLTGLVIHVLDAGPAGDDTWFTSGATLLLLGALALWDRAAFQPTPIEALGPDVDRIRVKHQRDLLLKSMAIVATLLVIVALFIEFIALLTLVGAIGDLSATQITLARNFLWIPALMLMLVGGMSYVRQRVPSSEESIPYQPEVKIGLQALIGFSSAVAILFSLGLAAIESRTEILARQGIYVQLVAVASLLVYTNLHLGFPNVIGIIHREIVASQEADRQGAKSLHRRMVRNYVIALVFVVGSVAFLVANAAGIVSTSGSNQADIFLIIYVMFGAFFLGLILVNFYQARQLRHKIFHTGHETGPIGKKRYDHATVVRMSVIWTSVGLAGLFLFFTILVGTGLMTSFGPIPLTPANGTDFFVLAALGGLGPYGFYYARESNRIRLIDEKFPDLLRDLAESQRAGMTLPRALVTAAKGEYGPLTKEVQTMSAQVEWGVNFTEALARFAKRTRTPLIERTVSLVIEAAQSGGNVVDILSAASDDAREIKGILQERKAQMSVYSLIIYIAFAVFLTVIGVLNSQFIPELAKSTAGVAGTDLGGIRFGEIDVQAYQQLFFHAALIQGIGGGLVSGVMTQGHPFSGMRHSFNMTLLAYVLFRFVIL